MPNRKQTIGGQFLSRCFVFHIQVLHTFEGKCQPSLVLTFLNPKQIAYEVANTFPAYQLIEDGFLCVAIDEMTTQDAVFIDVNANDPMLLLILHDMGNTNMELLENSEVILNKFSDVFILGRIE